MSAGQKQKLLAEVDARRDEIIEFLKSLVRIPSVTGDGFRSVLVGDHSGRPNESPGVGISPQLVPQFPAQELVNGVLPAPSL